MAQVRMPAEWGPHRATWISWPHEEADFPGKISVIPWVYVEIVRALSKYEPVEILCNSAEVRDSAERCLTTSGVNKNYRTHICPTNRSWLRDSAPTGVKAQDGKVSWVKWCFNAWAKYKNFELDEKVPEFVGKITNHPILPALRPDTGAPLVLEGGAIETDGNGTLLVTKECLLSDIQARNPGLSQESYEKAFAKYLGISKTIWLSGSCVGDDTHGHIDDAARFVSPGKVVLAYEANSDDPNHEISLANLRILEESTDATGRKLEITLLPFPRNIVFDGYPLPASYVNFYIANGTVLVPTFNDENDLQALTTIQELFPSRKVVGISCTDLILGLGTLHCLTQQEPE